MVVEAITQRQPHPAPYIAMQPGVLTLAQYDGAAKGLAGSAEEQALPYPEFVRDHRTVDGAGNNERYPWLGQGGRPYGQITLRVPAPDDILPDPPTLISAICARKEFQPAPNGISSLLPWVAFCAIHDFFRTDAGRGEDGDGVEREHVNVHSSYLDLQTLYGCTQVLQDSVRTFEGGKLKADAVADPRLKRLRSAAAIIVLFSREHNYICDQLAERHSNELDTDEKLFQKARLITCSVYINVILHDYAGGIMGYYPASGPAVSDPRGTKFTKPQGFIGSLEFLYMYHFHPTTPENLTPSVFASLKPISEDDPLDLDNELTGMMSVRSGAFGPHNTPEFLLPADVKAMMRCRSLRVGTFNDFRAAIGFERHTRMEDFSNEPDVVEILREHYRNQPDQVELMPGMLAESSKKTGWGAPDTMGFAIVSDALSSIRHDRLYTTDYTPTMYTKWGFRHGKATCLANLLQRHTEIKLPVGANPSTFPTAQLL